MPELPEVETIRRQLEPELRGRTIVSAEILDPRLTAATPQVTVAGALRGQAIVALDRRGKYLLLRLADGTLMLHLRMTGNLLLRHADDPCPPHLRARLTLDDDREIAFTDPRRFGTADYFAGDDLLDSYLEQRLGPEPFSDKFDAVYLAQAAAGRRTPVKAFLLDQRVVAGIGNIYADEALFRARIHPTALAGRLSRHSIARLVPAVKEALQAGIDAKGASIDDFRDAYGVKGSFQDQFLVHRRAGLSCPNCGSPVIKLRVAGRGTYVCRRCQRPQRRLVTP